MSTRLCWALLTEYRRISFRLKYYYCLLYRPPSNWYSSKYSNGSVHEREREFRDSAKTSTTVRRSSLGLSAVINESRQ